MAQEIMLFNPVTGERRTTTYKILEKVTGKPYGYLVSAKCKRTKIKTLGCYIVDASVPNKELRALMKKEVIDDEYWKDIPNSKYQVSSYGRYKCHFKNGKWDFMLPSKSKSRCSPKISLTIEGVKSGYLLHHFVFELFVEKPEGKNLVRCHKDNNKYNNRVSNLCWVTKAKCATMTAHGSRSMPVLRINMETGEEDYYESMADAGRDNFCNRETIRLAIKENRPAVGYMWKLYKIEED